ncbi:MAG: hypothetical protein GC201_16220 [Alphaproteobacteria bacterium]|nr:hypothetical protein [Alphaproteobacteria bacterium]
MPKQTEPVPVGDLALRSLALPAAASALLAMGVGMWFACGPVPYYALLGAPVFAAVGAVGGPEREPGSRWKLGGVSALINLIVIFALTESFASGSCGY